MRNRGLRLGQMKPRGQETRTEAAARAPGCREERYQADCHGPEVHPCRLLLKRAAGGLCPVGAPWQGVWGCLGKPGPYKYAWSTE